MKNRDKLLLIIMVILFLVAVGMMYYQNIYKEQIKEQYRDYYLVATANIEEGAKLTDKNTSWSKVDSGEMPENYIKSKNKEDVSKYIASSKLIKGEFISKDRVGDKKSASDKTTEYEIDLYPNFSTEIKEGDFIKLYVQIVDEETLKISNRLVLEKKEVNKVVAGDENRQISDVLRVSATDKEAIRYFNAKKRGSIIALKINEDVNKIDHKLEFISIEE